MPKGGLATTSKGWRGSRRSAASACTTTMASPNRCRSCRARPGWTSIATTRAAAADERVGDGAGAGTDVEHDGAGGDVGVSDEALRPSGVELVEPPPRR